MKFRSVGNEPVEADMTPMIDIVFQLLTFFMITITFENSKADERVKLPRDALARPPSVRPEHEFVINFGYERDEERNPIKPYPAIFYNEEFVPLEDFPSRLSLERRVMERLYPGEEVVKDVTVVIRADEEIPAGLVQRLIRQCQDAGYSKFWLRTRVQQY